MGRSRHVRHAAGLPASGVRLDQNVGYARHPMASEDSQRLSLFDLDAIREAFMKSVREHNVKDSDWGEYARLFIQQVAETNRRPENATDPEEGNP